MKSSNLRILAFGIILESRIALAERTVDEDLDKLNTFYPRDAWNQTFVDSQRARCMDPTAAQACCPGYCFWENDCRDKQAKVCCPVGYHRCCFGNIKIGWHQLDCCKDGVSWPQQGSDTRHFQTALDSPSTDVGFLQQICGSRPGGAVVLKMPQMMLVIAMASLMFITACVWQ